MQKVKLLLCSFKTTTRRHTGGKGPSSIFLDLSSIPKQPHRLTNLRFPSLFQVQ